VEKLQEITITNEDSEVMVHNVWDSWDYPYIEIYEDFREIGSFNTNQSLEIGNYTVELNYDHEITNRTIIIQFHAYYLDKDNIFQLEFLSPDMIV